MMFTPKNDGDKKEIKFGTSSNAGYKYSAKIDFSEDLSTQISKIMQEKKAKDELDFQIQKLTKVVKEFPKQKRERNLHYYYTVGKNLLFLDSKNFRKIKPYSAYRRIAEEVPELLKDMDIKRIADHLATMYRLAHVNKDDLDKASWDQWYEIMKFKEIYKKPKILKIILKERKFIGSGPNLRNKINTLIRKNDRKIKKGE